MVFCSEHFDQRAISSTALRHRSRVSKSMAGINAGGICGQFAFRPAGRLEKFPPLDLRKAAATIDQHWRARSAAPPGAGVPAA